MNLKGMKVGDCANRGGGKVSRWEFRDLTTTDCRSTVQKRDKERHELEKVLRFSSNVIT